MNQRQVILAVVAIGLVSGAIWLWQHPSHQADVKPAASTAPPSTPLAAARSPGDSDPGPEPAAPSAPAQVAPTASPPDVNNNVSAQVDAPSVDTTEPAERKFARGGRVDEPDQN